jgi:UDP-N-acetylmuramoylalanine--D-glutamate ligase
LNLNNKKVLVAGLGISGISAARFLVDRGARVTVTDAAPARELKAILPELDQLGVTAELGGHREETFLSADLIVLSPGVPHTLPEIKLAVEKGVPVWGEMELASRYITEPIIAVTGTNGKTTTTRLIGDMLQASGLRPFVGGNIGTPLIAYAGSMEKADVVVAEVSSFQLDTIVEFRPRVGVLLNISADHLDRYDGLQGYAESKARLFENQTAADAAVLNGADPLIQTVTAGIASRRLMFHTADARSGDALINCETVTLPDVGGKPAVLDLREVHLTGQHNRENIAAAALAVLAAGGSVRGVQDALNRFSGLPHRLEYITKIDGVRYYDDSKATNVDAVVRALEDFSNGIILILGGRDKGGDYAPLLTALSGKGKLLILIGEAAPLIEKAVGKAITICRADSMEEAVAIAHEKAVAGDTVMLSPACSSFDMFESYAHRGKVFCSAVLNLPKRDEK